MPSHDTTHDPAASRQAETATVRDGDHDRGLQFLQAILVDVCSPSPSILRVLAELPAHAELEPWQRPNLALRLQLGASPESPMRIYTVRRFWRAQRRFEFDVVLHEGPGQMLPWLRTRCPGDRFAFSGPRPHLLVPEREGTHTVIFADASALPAVHALLQSWPAERSADVFVSCNDAAAVDELPTGNVIRLHRLSEANRSLPTPLLASALQLTDPLHCVVWAAGEREEMRALRRHFLDLGLPREDVAVAGYWKRGETTTETDVRRLRSYQRLLASGGGIADVDDLADDI